VLLCGCSPPLRALPLASQRPPPVPPQPATLTRPCHCKDVAPGNRGGGGMRNPQERNPGESEGSSFQSQNFTATSSNLRASLTVKAITFRDGLGPGFLGSPGEDSLAVCCWLRKVEVESLEVLRCERNGSDTPTPSTLGLQGPSPESQPSPRSSRGRLSECWPPPVQGASEGLRPLRLGHPCFRGQGRVSCAKAQLPCRGSSVAPWGVSFPPTAPTLPSYPSPIPQANTSCLTPN